MEKSKAKLPGSHQHQNDELYHLMIPSKNSVFLANKDVVDLFNKRDPYLNMQSHNHPLVQNKDNKKLMKVAFENVKDRV